MATDCDWPIDPACLTDDWAALDPEVQARASALATSSLRRLSGYRVGGCPIEVRPCVLSCVSTYSLAWARAQYPWMRGWGPTQLGDGSWVNTCGCVSDCSCTALCEVVLAPPVGTVSWVKVDGATVPSTDYRVDGDRLLWIGAGPCPWPACQDMTADSDQPGTFSVRYLNAHTPDALAAYAAGVLAVEFAKACTGSKCRLPGSVTSVARQGVAFELSNGVFPDGLTGIREIDAWIELWRPPGAPSRSATVWYPGQRMPRVVA